ncbi:MAG: DNA polymerase III subunit delta [Bacteroidetes bacterium GWE2_41_25]|nr:MAG: DNA polymerase III subunit delta [Bacteroidetes bacterium GWA2_40_15]OFY11392.1 MAG: DNA polymerase III subunit delta [Bacteroidetes bacterium GWE2_41_25]OFY61948.1 MAG: DNA polymerase III subunit delta [Bacteroidetes bacterium GWF2_41_9]HAM09567.1 DNA polymerase III subunit delta [Bacteroidales bacterium]HBQ83059.1 DNA polymerase III subunit delta [Bacteroidales bacterium]
MAATYEEIISDLKKRIFKPVYFLAGEEPYFIDLISDYIEDKVLSDADKAFNQIIVYGDDTNISAIIDTARRFPMMSSHQVVIVKEAQSVKKIEDIVVYLEKPLLSTILVFCYKYKSIDKRTRLFKILDSNAIYFESPRFRDYQIPAWIERYLMTKGIKSEPSASALLTEYLGTDLHKIANELDKLIITLPASKPMITNALIEKNIGISKDYNNFELQKAIGERNILKSNMIIRYFADNPKDNPITLTIASLFSLFSKLLTYHYLPDKSKNNVAAALKVHPFFVKDYESAAVRYNAKKTVEIVSLLRTYDMRSKGYNDPGTEPGDLMKELVFRILHI